MNNKNILDFENMTMKQICSCLGLLNKLVEENIIKFDINKSEAVLNYDEAVRCIEKQNKLYKSILDKIKEYVKNNEKCIVECSGRDIMTGMPYTKIKTGLIEKTRIEELLEEIE